MGRKGCYGFVVQVFGLPSDSIDSLVKLARQLTTLLVARLPVDYPRKATWDNAVEATDVPQRAAMSQPWRLRQVNPHSEGDDNGLRGR